MAATLALPSKGGTAHIPPQFRARSHRNPAPAGGMSPPPIPEQMVEVVRMAVESFRRFERRSRRTDTLGLTPIGLRAVRCVTSHFLQTHNGLSARCDVQKRRNWERTTRLETDCSGTRNCPSRPRTAIVRLLLRSGWSSMRTRTPSTKVPSSTREGDRRWTLGNQGLEEHCPAEEAQLLVHPARCPHGTTTGAGFWTAHPSVPPQCGKFTVSRRGRVC